MIEVQFEDRHTTCYFDDSIPVLSHRWKGFVNAENFTGTLMRMMDLYTKLKEKCPNLTWLGDTTQLGALNSVTQVWLKDVWPVILETAGVKKYALIVPSSLFAKIALDKFVGNLQSSHKAIEIKYFVNEVAANEWLKESN